MGELEYAPRAKWFERRWVKRVVVWGIVLGVLGVTVWEMLPGMLRRGRMMYWQGKCMEYGEGPGVVSARAAAAMTITTGPGGGGWTLAPLAPLGPVGFPREIEEFTGSLLPTPEVGALMPGPPSGTLTLLSMYDWPSHYFMHGRRSAAGERLIVAWVPGRNMYAGSESFFDYSPKPYRVSVFKPGGLFWDAKLLSSKGFYLNGDWKARTIFGGFEAIEVDGENEAAFVVPVRVWHWDGKDLVAVVHRHKFVLRGDGAEVELAETVPRLGK